MVILSYTNRDNYVDKYNYFITFCILIVLIIFNGLDNSLVPDSAQYIDEAKSLNFIISERLPLYNIFIFLSFKIFNNIVLCIIINIISYFAIIYVINKILNKKKIKKNFIIIILIYYNPLLISYTLYCIP